MWEQWLEEFLEELRQVHQSPNTVEARRRWLSRFISTCRRLGVKEPTEVTPAHVEAFRNELLWLPSAVTGQLYAQHTVDHALSCVRLWMGWAVRRSKMLIDPTEQLVLPRRPPVRKGYLTMAQIERLLEAPDRSRPAGLRNWAVLETLYSTGMRRGELHALDLADVNFEARTIRVQGKGAWERLVPMGETLAAALDLYLQTARPYLLYNRLPPKERREQLAFFLSTMGTRFSLQMIAQTVEEAAQQAGLQGVSTHMLRHSFATHMLENGADFFDVQALLGHLHPQSTEIYTPLEARVLRATFRLTHPRAARKTPPEGLPTKLRHRPNPLFP